MTPSGFITLRAITITMGITITTVTMTGETTSFTGVPTSICRAVAGSSRAHQVILKDTKLQADMRVMAVGTSPLAHQVILKDTVARRSTATTKATTADSTVARRWHGEFPAIWYHAPRTQPASAKNC